ncbi:restriction endonuclease subunit S [Priestia flexa]|uniref:restriction endonuclease subunit S n=1 Tax=Priestia flexa TaxID=86664 RepID=UPI001EF64F23|nr:restriction endonuclease subunit S [Priestia flexa]MCG7314463.1 restriction endonuclease subunit S [Priestia flexa]
MTIKTIKEYYPLDWTEASFKDLFEFEGGLSISRANLSDEGICYLHYGDIHKSTESFVNVERDYNLIPKYDTTLEEVKEKYLLREGDIVFADASEDYAGIGKSVVVINPQELPFISGLHTIVAKDKTNKLDNGYKRFFLTDWNIRKQLMVMATGISVYGLSKTNLEKIRVVLPPKEEQQKIASILSTWDKAIELKEKLIEQKKEQKKGLMQKLLTGEVRLPGFDGEWIKIKISKLIGEINEKSTINNQYNVLSVTKNGIVSQNEQFKKQVASENNVGYKVIRKNNLVFSTMNLWMGSLDVLTDYEIGIVSPAYKVFEFNLVNIIPSFAKFYMLSEHMIWLYNVNSEQGASIVRRNLDLKALLNTIVKVPSIQEQQAISKVLIAINKEIKLLENELELFKQQKQGLMQLLLTGKVRVKV